MPRADHPAASDRSRRMLVCYAVALALLGALGLFCWLVVRPVLEARAVIGDVYGKHCARQAGLDSFDAWVPENEVKAALERLGGPEKAIPALRIYVRLPDRLAPYTILAVQMLGRCGKEAVPTLIGFIRNQDHMGNDAVDAAVVELGDFGSEARAAVPVLTELRKSAQVGLCESIDEAIEKIRAEKPPPPPGDAPKSD